MHAKILFGDISSFNVQNSLGPVTPFSLGQRLSAFRKHSPGLLQEVD